MAGDERAGWFKWGERYRNKEKEEKEDQAEEG